MRRRLNYAAVLVLLTLAAGSAVAQTEVKVDGESKTVYMLREVGAILKQGDGSVALDAVLPRDSRPEGYRKIDVRQGDEILVFNGKRVKSLDAFQLAYATLAIGETITLEIRRGEEKGIVTFDKVDPEKLPQGRAFTIQGNMTPATKEQEGVTVNHLTLGPEPGALRALPGTNLLLGMSGKEIKVLKDAQGKGEAIVNTGLEAGDFIVRLNGKPASSLGAFFKRYDAIPDGEPVTLRYRRGAQEATTAYKKPAQGASAAD